MLEELGLGETKDKEKIMANKQKYYAVKKGNATGIFLTWAECQEATKGFSGPEFKSFESEEEAKAYISGEDIILTSEIHPRIAKGEAVAFVDGSFDATKKAYGSGVCIFAPGDIYVELSNRGNNEKYIDLRNVAGEIIGALIAIDWAWKNGFAKLAIYHDYEGISKWATGEWKANKNLSQYYKKFVDEKKDFLDIEFVKVSGHSNNKYNDRVDALAKGAIFENKVIRDNGENGGYIISPVREDDITALLGKLKEECSGLDYIVLDNGNKKTWSIQFGKDKLGISLFNNIKMMVQGRRSNLFQIVTTGIVENIKCGDFIQVLKDAYRIAIDKVKVDTDFTKYLANLTVALPQTIELLLKQSLIDLENKAYGDVEFSKYTYTVLRALDGTLKHNLQKCSIPMNSYSFTMFDKDTATGAYVVQIGHKNRISASDALKLENCYNHFYNHRHTLSHFGIFIGNTDIDNTRLIRTKQDADTLIKETLKIINDNYIV